MDEWNQSTRLSFLNPVEFFGLLTSLKVVDFEPTVIVGESTWPLAFEAQFAP